MPSLRPATPCAAVVGVMALCSAHVLALLWGGRAIGDVERELAAVLWGHAAGLAALAWVALDRRLAATPVAWVLLAGLVLRVLAATATPLLEDDHHRYLWDGMRTATALAPYRLPPEAFFGDHSLSPAWQAVLSGINHPDLPTLYGPVLQGLFALAWALAPAQLGSLQALLVLVDMAVLLALARWPVRVRWLWVYALHPMVLKEALASAHPDGLTALLLLGAAAAWQRGRAWQVGLWLGAACATKVSALVVLPLLLMAPHFSAAQWAAPQTRARWVWGVKVAAGLVLALVVLYLPFALSGGSDLPTLRHFAQQWRFNPLLFRLLESAAGPYARLLAGVAVAGTVALLAWRLAHRGLPGGVVPAMAWALFALLLLAPVNNPWYGLWLLPLALIARQASGVVLASVTTVSYLNGHWFSVGLSAWLPQGLTNAPYVVPWPLTLAQLLAVGLALAWDLRHYGVRDQRLRSR